MAPIRVLIVDDSAVIRRMLTDILTEDPEIEVIGAAGSGAIALHKLSKAMPDIITLDVEMPDMSGLETLTEIRKMNARVPVIMFSSLTERAGAITLDALSRGATDYVTKPANTGSVEASVQHVREQLLPKIKAIGARARTASSVGRGATSAAPAPAAARVTKPSTDASPARPRVAGPIRHVDVVAIASSTGGPNALADVFAQLTPNLPVPLLLVQHMPPIFTRLLAERLQAICKFPVREAVDGEILEPGCALIAPGNYHLSVVRDGKTVRAVLDQAPPENSCRPAADVLFRSVASVYGAGALGVVLTGMGQDGLKGGTELVNHGGAMITQDEATSVVWGMPGFVTRAGIADATLPISEIAGEVTRRIMSAPRSLAPRRATAQESRGVS